MIVIMNKFGHYAYIYESVSLAGIRHANLGWVGNVNQAQLFDNNFRKKDFPGFFDELSTGIAIAAVEHKTVERKTIESRIVELLTGDVK